MRFLIFSLLSFTATFAIACPDLGGTYQCEKDSDDPSDSGIISVSMDTYDGGPVYVLTDKDEPNEPSYLPANNTTYPLENNGTYKGWCDASVFYVKVTGTDDQIGNFVLNMTTTLDTNQNLLQSGNLKSDAVEGNFNETCTRL